MTSTPVPDRIRALVEQMLATTDRDVGIQLPPPPPPARSSRPRKGRTA